MSSRRIRIRLAPVLVAAAAAFVHFHGWSGPSTDAAASTLEDDLRAAGFTPVRVRTETARSHSSKEWEAVWSGRQPPASPFVLVGAAKDWPAVERWGRPEYVWDALAGMSEPVVLVGSTPYMRGTDATLDRGSLRQVIGPATADGHSYAGLVNIHGTALLRDVGPTPYDHLLRSNRTRACLWASNGEVDSGLHWDENQGGFLTQIVGRKEVLLFPPSDSPRLYPSQERFHHMESRLFVRRDLPDLATKWPLLRHTSPHIAALDPGDMIYIPHKWWHEVWSSNRSLAFSSWVRDP